MDFLLNFNGLIIEIENEEIISKNDAIPLNGIKSLKHFIPVISEDGYVCVEDYKIFHDVHWSGDDDVDSYWIFQIICSYIGNMLGLSVYEENGHEYKVEITLDQIKRIENAIAM